MSKTYLLGMDVGTTGTKALLFDSDGCLVGSAYRGYETFTSGDLIAEQNAEDWWKAIVETVKQVCADRQIASCVKAISLSSQGGTLVPVDSQNTPLRRAVVWSDKRCAKEAERFNARFGSDYMYRKTGWKLGRSLPALQIMHLRYHEPDIFARTAMFLTVPDYVSLKMTGRAAVDISNAGINHLCDISRGCYDRDILDFIGIKESQLACILPSCTPVGRLTVQAAQELGLSTECVLVSGAHDQYAVALGAGANNGGDVLIGSGTTWVVTAISDNSRFDSGVAQSVAAAPGKWGSLVSIGTGGVCLEWFRKNLQMLSPNGELLTYDEINEGAAQKDAGSGGMMFFPYFGGSPFPQREGQARGTFLGLTLSHDRFDMARAIMEGVCFQIVWVLEEFKKDFPLSCITLAGGAAKSSLWPQILADIANLPVRVPEVADLACVGAAVMAGVGTGVFSDPASGCKKLETGERIIYPDPKNAAVYAEIFKKYKKYAGALCLMYRS